MLEKLVIKIIPTISLTVFFIPLVQLIHLADIENYWRWLHRLKKRKRNITIGKGNKCLCRRLACCSQTGQGYDQSIEQYSLLQRVLADVNGLPHKGNKSNWTKKLQDPYTLLNITPFLQVLDWIPKVVIIDNMFLIIINPLRQHKLMHQYADLLLR